MSQQNLSRRSSPAVNDSGGNGVPAVAPATAKGTSLLNIVRAQVFFLLSTLTEDKWDLTVNQLRQLSEQNGPEVYSHLLRRLIQSNAAQIFPHLPTTQQSSPPNPATYRLLKEELSNLAKVEQIRSCRLHDAIHVEGNSDPVWRDFDLRGFLRHFGFDVFSTVILGLQFILPRSITKELFEKAAEILNESHEELMVLLRDPSKRKDELTPEKLATFVSAYLEWLNRNETRAEHVTQAVRARYGRQMPAPVAAVITPVEQRRAITADATRSLAEIFAEIGPEATTSREAVLTVFARKAVTDKSSAQRLLTPDALSECLQYMIGTTGWNGEIMASVIGPGGWEVRADARAILRSLDHEATRVSDFTGLLVLVEVLTVISENGEFPIDELWKEWDFPLAQISILRAIIACPQDKWDVLSVPRVRKVLTAQDVAHTASGVQALAALLENQTWNVLDLVLTALRLVTSSGDAGNDVSDEARMLLDKAAKLTPELVFLGAAQGPQPWPEGHQQLVERGFSAFFIGHPSHQLVFARLWQVNKSIVEKYLWEYWRKNKMNVPRILDVVQDGRAVEDFLGKLMAQGRNDESREAWTFAIDLAALGGRMDYLNPEKWLTDRIAELSDDFVRVCLEFLNGKAAAEIALQQAAQLAAQGEPGVEPPMPTTVNLRVETVAVFLRVLMNNPMNSANAEIFRTVQSSCLQVYPRLMNIGQGHDAAILANEADHGNTFARDVEKEVETYYQRMYEERLPISDVIVMLQRLKESDEPRDQDVFACMLHSLFDEYRFFADYPANALAITAVLFGSLIHFGLVSHIPLGIALRYVLESLKEGENQPEGAAPSNMFKFGVQALMQFQGRVHEWPQYCQHLFGLPALERAQPELMAQIRADADEAMRRSTPSPTKPPFSSIRSEGFGIQMVAFEDPGEQVQDKVLFAVNNVSSANLEQKVNELRDCLPEKHFQWFAKYLVLERAAIEPNYHELYVRLLETFGNRVLLRHTMHETLEASLHLLNSEESMGKGPARDRLLHLASWLGEMTLARDKPIKHKNVSFKDLMLEGHDSGRLALAVHYTANVLTQVSRSRVFKPPNAWTMAIFKLLKELYIRYIVTEKTSDKEVRKALDYRFESLCIHVGLDIKKLEPSDLLDNRPKRTDEDELLLQQQQLEQRQQQLQQIQRLQAAGVADVTGDMEKLGLAGDIAGIGNGVESPAMSNVDAIMPSLAQHIVINPNVSFMIHQPGLKRVLQLAIDKAIREIIAPVVERSVTIAGISTRELITKDFAVEGNADSMRKAARIMVQNLAGSLALVTCKEPLRISMTNHIRNYLMQNGVNESNLPEHAIMVTVSDNLDLACSIIEKAAMDKAVPEIDEGLAPAYLARAQHRQERPGQPYFDPSASRYAVSLPDPLRLKSSGLTPQQLAVYDEFNRVPRTASQAGAVPQGYEGREGAAPARNLGEPGVTPSFTAATPVAPAAPQPAREAPEAPTKMPAIIPPTLTAAASQALEKLLGGIAELERVIQDSPKDVPLVNVPPEHDIRNYLRQIPIIASQTLSREDAVLVCAQKTCAVLYANADSLLARETFVTLLDRLCELSEKTAKDVAAWLLQVDDERKYVVPVTTTLIRAALINPLEYDGQLVTLLEERDAAAIDYTAAIIFEATMGPVPVASRMDFPKSIDAFEKLVAEDKESWPAPVELLRALQQGVDEANELVEKNMTDERANKEQLAFIFAEWIRICQHPASNDKVYLAFIYQLQQQGILEDDQLHALFFRVALDLSVENYLKQAAQGTVTINSYVPIDALAKLIVILVRYNAEVDQVRGEAPTKQTYFAKVLAVINMIFAHTHEIFGEAFNQKPFFRLFSTILSEIQTYEHALEDIQIQLYTALCDAFLVIQPKCFPGFAFGWMSLLSHRLFLPKMLLFEDKRGWQPYSRLLVCQLEFLAPHLKDAEIKDSVRHLYKGLLRCLLVILHDFPEFLCEYHFALGNAIASNSTQLRNLILSAFPRNMRLPDPFTQGLKVDRLPEIRESPDISNDYLDIIEESGVKPSLDAYLANHQAKQTSDFPKLLLTRVLAAPHALDVDSNFPEHVKVDRFLLGAIVLYVGIDAIKEANAKSNGGPPSFQPKSAHMALLTTLFDELNPEGRYYFLGAIANQLRFPSSHTHYYSCVLLSLFSNANDDVSSKEQITRILLERLICNRPHPWGLLITFTELLKNTHYNFWALPFIKSAPEVERLFNSLYSHINAPAAGPPGQFAPGVIGQPEAV
ncbi:CCR4-NOT core subunit cdc39 [Saitoella coloradoensis]